MSRIADTASEDWTASPDGRTIAVTIQSG